MSQWGIWDKALGNPDQWTDSLLDAYLRRLQFEQKAMAVAVVNTLAKAMDSKSNAQQVSADEFLRIAGGLDGFDAG